MSTYSKPTAILTDTMSEGVFAASGASNSAENHVSAIISNGCMKADWLGNNVYQAGIKWTYDGGKGCKGFRATAKYDKPVTFYAYYPGMQTYVSGDGTDTLVIDFNQDEATSGHMMNITVSSVDGSAATCTGISVQCLH